jgi:clusterin-associated protein 1
MRSLGFHQQISMDSFHSPNFALVSEVLLWLALRFEPDINLPHEIETSEQRVYFIRSIVEFFVSNSKPNLIPTFYNIFFNRFLKLTLN